MKVLIRKATIISPSLPHHGLQKDILIENGIISKIDDSISAGADRIISIPNLHISSGWMDCFANFCDPGAEYKETVQSGARAAAAGGFTDIMLVPNTQPAVHNKSQVDYLIQKGALTAVNIHPIGAITANTEGKELSEMYDMHAAGAIAFSDGYAPVQSSGILQKALEYVLAVDSTIIQLPDDTSIGRHGQMNEGVISTQLGLPGKPAIAEELLISRDIELARYTNSRIHFTGVSTQKSIELIAAAKKEGVKVSCSVTPYHLYFCDEDLHHYDTELKVNPPLRTKKERDFLLNAVSSGMIDFIASHHSPQDYDHKVCEFEKASFGMETLETVFSAAITCGITVDTFVLMQTKNVKHVFNQPFLAIAEGAPAVITLFDPEADRIYSKNDLLSKSKNNAFLNRPLRGKVFGIINKERIFLPSIK